MTSGGATDNPRTTPAIDDESLGADAVLLASPLLTIDSASLGRIATDSDGRWRSLLEYWSALAKGRGAYPSRTQIDPISLGSTLLPILSMIDVLRDAGRIRFRFRLLGQTIIDRTSARAGAFLDEVAHGPEFQEIHRHYLSCLQGKTWLRRSSLAWSDSWRARERYSALVLPLADDGMTVSHLIGFAVPEFAT